MNNQFARQFIVINTAMATVTYLVTRDVTFTAQAAAGAIVGSYLGSRFVHRWMLRKFEERRQMQHMYRTSSEIQAHRDGLYIPEEWSQSL